MPGPTSLRLTISVTPPSRRDTTMKPFAELPPSARILPPARAPAEDLGIDRRRRFAAGAPPRAQCRRTCERASCRHRRDPAGAHGGSRLANDAARDARTRVAGGLRLKSSASPRPTMSPHPIVAAPVRRIAAASASSIGSPAMVIAQRMASGRAVARASPSEPCVRARAETRPHHGLSAGANVTVPSPNCPASGEIGDDRRCDRVIDAQPAASAAR